MWAILPQSHDRSTPPTSLRRGISKAFHKSGPGQDRSYNFALDADAPAMNDSQSLEPQPPRLFQVLFYDRLDIPRWNAVQVEYIGNGNLDRLFWLLHCC